MRDDDTHHTVGDETKEDPSSDQTLVSTATVTDCTDTDGMEHTTTTTTTTTSTATTTTTANTNHRMVATARRTNTAPPKMAFLQRVGRRNDSHNNNNNNDDDEETTRHAQPGNSSSSSAAMAPAQAHAMEEEFMFDDDMTASLLPSSSPRTDPTSTGVHGSTVLQHDDSPATASFRQLLRRSGNYLAYVTLLTMLIVVPSVLYSALTNRKVDIAAFHSAWVMVCGTIVMSLRLVYLHLTHWYMPSVQKYVVRILWMVPIYAIQSYFSLRFHHSRVYMSAIRDFYEAYVIASFVYYLMELLGGQDSLVRILREKDPALGDHKFPFSLLLQRWDMGLEFLLQCKHGVLQYVVFKTTASVLTCLCEFMHIYGEGTFNWLNAYPYLVFFQNISVWYALYSLVIFFHAVNENLRHPVDWHPLGKFLCIKGVVFFTWWQGVVIFYLRDHGIIAGMGSWSSLDVANGLIDYCIIVEMIGFSIAHSYTFTYTEYMPGRLPPASVHSSGTDGAAAGSAEATTRTVSPSYQPPATLHQPLDFRTAFWSSTVPRETLQDIQRLRSGIDGAMARSEEAASNRQRCLSLQEMNEGGNQTDPLVVNSGLERADSLHV